MSDAKQLFIVRGRSGIQECSDEEFYDFITTSEEFKKFTRNAVDLDVQERNSVCDKGTRIQHFSKAIKKGFLEFEDRAIQGIERVVDTQKGKVKIGFTQIRENRIYVYDGEKYHRGIKVFFSDLCLVGAMDYVPLDKSLGNGVLEIILWNKRTSTKAIKFIHNKLQSILYIIDMEFENEEDMLLDMENPQELNLTSIIEPLL